MLEYYIVEPVAKSVFMIDPDTGAITSRISLKDVTINDWQVCIWFKYICKDLVSSVIFLWL